MDWDQNSPFGWKQRNYFQDGNAADLLQNGPKPPIESLPVNPITPPTEPVKETPSMVQRNTLPVSLTDYQQTLEEMPERNEPSTGRKILAGFAGMIGGQNLGLAVRGDLGYVKRLQNWQRKAAMKKEKYEADIQNQKNELSFLKQQYEMEKEAGRNERERYRQEGSDRRQGQYLDFRYDQLEQDAQNAAAKLKAAQDAGDEKEVQFWARYAQENELRRKDLEERRRHNKAVEGRPVRQSTPKPPSTKDEVANAWFSADPVLRAKIIEEANKRKMNPLQLFANEHYIKSQNDDDDLFGDIRVGGE